VPNLGVGELVVIFMILLLVFGASRLPALGEGLGRTIRGFKRGLDGPATPKPITTPAPTAEAKDAAKATVARSEADEAELVDKTKS